MSEKLLRDIKKKADQLLKAETREALAKIFTMLSCKGVANEIKRGRNVVGNAEFGIRHCVHPKLGPRVNVDTMKFTPQSTKAKRIEKGFITYTNKLLENAGYKKMSPKLLTHLRQGDKTFERRIAKRRKRR